MSFRLFKRGMINFGIMLLLFVNTTPLIELPIINKLELIFSDQRLNFTMPKGVDDRVVIADIDEASINEFGHWPWNRDRLAQLVDILFEHYQIKVLGFDIIFSEADDVSGLRVLEQLDAVGIQDKNYQKISTSLKKQMAFDDIFAQSIKGRNVVLGMVFDQANSDQLNRLKPAIKNISFELSNKINIAKPVGYSANIDVINQAADSVGFFDNPNITIDGSYRRVPLIQLYEQGLYPSLALAVTRKAINDVDYYIDIETVGDYAAIEQVQLGSLLIPVDETGSVTVPYRGPAGSFPYLSVKNIINKSIALEQLKGKIVLLGTSAPGLQDLRTTPVDSALPGVEVHANIITGILDQRIPYLPAYILAIELIIILVIGVLMMMCGRLSPVKMIAFSLILAAIYIGLNIMLWQQGIILFIATPMLLILAMFIVHMSWGFFSENRIKRTITSLFGQYVPPELVNEMVNKPELASVEGKSCELTVLFADIRGFTTVSEKLSPQELSEFLNQFLTPLTKVIYDSRGTIDKYMGDCIMAFWGAPIPEQAHAEQGVQAALNMLEKVDQLQAEFSARGWPEVKIGVGLNTGMMSVGNMGSEYRMAYTVLGDAVNLGARIEALTKQYGVSLMVSEFTKAAAPDFVYRQLDQVKVKGKNEAVTIFGVVGTSATVNDELIADIDKFHQALEFYYQQNWHQAKLIIEVLAQKYQDQTIDSLYQLYLTRITEYQLNPPEDNWDGVYSHLTK